MRQVSSALTALVLVCVFGLMVSGPAHAHAHGDGHGHSHGHQEHKEDKVGILLVAFGSSYPQAQVAFENIEDQVQKAFPGKPVCWAYTSQKIRRKMAKEGEDLDSPAQALADMQDEGFTHVAVQSLHTIAGAEFHDLQSVVNGFASMSGGFEEIMLGYPLLATPHDLEHVHQAMLENIPAERKKDEAVIFMGHGTYHPSNAFYQAVAFELQQDDPNVYMGTIGGPPGLEEIVADLEQKDIQKAYLMPFMSVAGDHVRNDMAGDGPDSWKSLLNEAGIKSEPVLKGTAEYDNLVDIWVDHLKGVMEHFK
ncbi:MAG: sirohydrochlorin cobaltochelatase [Desulfovermiculus sp.]